MMPIFTPSRVNVVLLDHSGGVSFVAGSMTFADTYGKICQWNEGVAQIGLASVKVMVAQAISTESHHVHQFDGRRVAEER